MNQHAIPAFRIPRRRPGVVVATSVTGLGVLLWLGMEDVALLPVMLLALALTVCLLLAGITTRLGGRSLSFRWLIITSLLAGAGCGAGTSLASAGLMLIKSALHSHAKPDFALPVLVAVVALIPGWAVAGALIGLGAALLWAAAKLPRPDH